MIQTCHAWASHFHFSFVISFHFFIIIFCAVPIQGPDDGKLLSEPHTETKLDLIGSVWFHVPHLKLPASAGLWTDSEP